MSASSSGARICLDARLTSASGGGVAQALMGLADALSDLTDGGEEYLFLTFSNPEGQSVHTQWLDPHIRGRCRLLAGQVLPERPPEWKDSLKARIRRSTPVLERALRKLPPLPGWRPPPPMKSDGAIERAGAEVMHFTLSDSFLTEIPTVYQPWDLQHIHLPEFFSVRARWAREQNYRLACERASVVIAASTWGKNDLVHHFRLAPEKITVVPGAPPTSAYDEPTSEQLRETARKFSLPERFIFFPAQTFRHKNHLALLEALALLRDRDGVTVPLVCSGKKNEFFPKIQDRIRELNLTGQTSFLGFISELELQCLYKLCRMMVFPSKFEGWGLPLTEAFHAGVPVACSNVTCLPAMAAGAAELFDPNKPDQIAAAVKRLWTDDARCAELIRLGHASVARFTWDRSARLFRAVYRRITGKGFTAADAELLAADPGV